jgi:hypothetical protein
MERRVLGAGLMVLASSLVLMAGTASAHGTVSPQGTSTQITSAANCLIKSDKASSVNQGEFKLEGTVGDVVEVECNTKVFPPGTPIEISDAQLFSRCTGGIRWVVANEFGTNLPRIEDGRSVTVGLDGDGNATVALVAGPHCAVGETVISGHTGAPEFESFSTAFSIEGAKPTPEGLYITPVEQVESTGSSSVVALVEVEYANAGEDMVRIASPELFKRCAVGGLKLSWLRMNKEVVLSAKELVGGTALEPKGTEAIKLDNDGNGFVIAVGHESCSTGRSIFEADLETSPFTTLEMPFTIKPPQETEF